MSKSIALCFDFYYIVMAYIVMAHIVMATAAGRKSRSIALCFDSRIVMAYIGLYSYGLYRPT